MCSCYTFEYHLAHLFILAAFNSFDQCMLENVKYFYLKELLCKTFDMGNMVFIILFSDISKCFNKLQNVGLFEALCSLGHFEAWNQMFGNYFTPGVIEGGPASGDFQS